MTAKMDFSTEEGRGDAPQWGAGAGKGRGRRLPLDPAQRLKKPPATVPERAPEAANERGRA